MVSDELRSLTSSASCCATVEITNINVSGEALHCHGKKTLKDRSHFASHVFSQTPSETVPVVLQGKPENDMKFSPCYPFFSSNSSDQNISILLSVFSSLSYRTGIFVLLMNNSVPHAEILALGRGTVGRETYFSKAIKF